jgi:probable F420-dependent oxidoreductase
MDLPRHPFRFGVQASVAEDARSWTDLARRAEDLGYATLSVADHFRHQFAPTPALMAAAGATTTLRLASMVYCNDLHHPLVLAKEAATMDLLSDGRLELGIGAGWMPADYEATGIPMDPPGVRIERLGEAVRIVKGALGGGPVDHDGTHYRVHVADTSPLPVQRPHPPIFLGGGARRMLTLAGAEADIVGLNIDMRSGTIGPDSGPSATDEATTTKLGWIAAAAGERFAAIEIQVRIELAAVTDDPMALAEALSPAFGLTAQQGLASPHALVGSTEGIAELCRERRERFGISYITVPVEAMAELAGVVSVLAGT